MAKHYTTALSRFDWIIRKNRKMAKGGSLLVLGLILCCSHGHCQDAASDSPSEGILQQTDQTRISSMSAAEKTLKKNTDEILLNSRKSALESGLDDLTTITESAKSCLLISMFIGLGTMVTAIGVTIFSLIFGRSNYRANEHPKNS